ncbi:thiamine ABC transporter substrate-binding protein [soil metagenome]
MHKAIPLVAIAALLLSGCASTAATPNDSITLITHDSFALSKGTLAKFTKQTGIKVTVQAAGDAGELVNKLVLTKDSPLGDAVYGVDNTFASRAVEAGVLENYVSKGVTDAESQYLLPAGQGKTQLTPIDSSDVCVNVDHRWFTKHDVAEPVTLDDLTKPAYKNLFVVEAANSSSPGLAFLLATIAAFPHSWQDYWKKLMANGTRVDASWDDAYYTDFSGPSSKGDRPIVVSYASSPPFEVPKGTTETPTGALLDTCFKQTEFAGVLAGTKNPVAAKKLVDFLHSATVQNDIPENMYVFPVNPAATLPSGWDVTAPRATKPFTVSPDDIDKNRSTWLTQWAAIATP